MRLEKGTEMNEYYNDQEKFWAGVFGDDYTQRNQGESLLASNVALFSKIFSQVAPLQSMIEFGANRGINLHALRVLFPFMETSAVEINQSAVEELAKIGKIKIYHQSIQDFACDYQRDLVLIKGVLIHLSPITLKNAYTTFYRASKRYICIAEYYNPFPTEVSYRGHKDKLFKRDFAGEMLEQFSDLRLINYGFAYHKDPSFPQDDINWFLLEKCV